MELRIGRDAERFQWDDLKMKIELWIQVAKVCFYKLFDMEKQICGQIFEGFGVESIEECFVEIVTDPANNLLIFAETVSLSNQPSERIGTILGLYDTSASLLPKIDALFNSKAAEAIRTGAKGLVFRLEDDGKSEQYKHVPLRHLFMMNDVFYVVQKIQGSHELREMIGDDYMAKLNWNVEQAMTSYQVSTCNKFLSCFREDGLYVSWWCFCSQVSKGALRKRFTAFNSQFEEIQKFHSNCTVPDLELREKLRVSMVDKLIPAYKEFLRKFRTYTEIEQNSETQTKSFQKINVKHSVEDLEALISKHLFSYNEI
ncbi:exocyst complex component EXO70A1-like [Olea europaea subsp. europaea]|uniref:Exocyst subunit Exo70 family protein n=1 Tax=Olea europaea subsp. europaea TaxID=158383 RepID=A0A8S0TAU8_OLEEU|nr:exocyst complex component EXO70A1-like [Olea europaea subsp. europaea]